MIQSLEIKHARIIDSLHLELKEPIVLITGQNGSGKTSVLESIYLASTTKSHRTSDEKEMIQLEKPFMSIKIKQEKQLFEIVMTKHGKRMFVNRNEIRKMSDYMGHLRVVMFAPEDLNLIKGSPSDRRYFIDLEMIQLDKQYLRLLTTYRKILKQRNSLLKKIKIMDDYTFLNILGNQLYEVGAQIFDCRMIFIETLNQYLKTRMKKYADMDVSIHYQPNLSKEAFKKHLNEKQKQDIMYEQTMVGIHKDDFEIRFNDVLAKQRASQGQQRLITIELKLALLEHISKQTKQEVILLLDDVLSELDYPNIDLFIHELPKQHQVIMTSAVVPFKEKNKIQRITLEKGVKQDV